jgi:hypothetical protein
MENEIRRVIAELGRGIVARDFGAAVSCFSAEAVRMVAASNDLAYAFGTCNADAGKRGIT